MRMAANGDVSIDCPYVFFAVAGIEVVESQSVCFEDDIIDSCAESPAVDCGVAGYRPVSCGGVWAFFDDRPAIAELAVEGRVAVLVAESPEKREVRGVLYAVSLFLDVFLAEDIADSGIEPDKEGLRASLWEENIIAEADVRCRAIDVDVADVREDSAAEEGCITAP